MKKIILLGSITASLAVSSFASDYYVGYGYQSILSGERKVTASSQGVSASVTQKVDSGNSSSLKIGRDFDTWRAEIYYTDVEIKYKNTAKKNSFDGLGIEFVKPLFKASVFDPYVNIGVGYYAANITYNSQKKSTSSFSLTYGLGVLTSLTSTLELDLGYRGIRHSWEQIEINDSVLGKTTIDYEEKSNSVYLGLNYKF